MYSSDLNFHLNLIWCTLFFSAISFTFSGVAIFRNVYIANHQDELIALMAMMSPISSDSETIVSSSLITSISSNQIESEYSGLKYDTSELYDNEFIINNTFVLPKNSIQVNEDTFIISEKDVYYHEDENGTIIYDFSVNSNSNLKRGATTNKSKQKMQVVAHVHKSHYGNANNNNNNNDFHGNYATTCYVFNAVGSIWKSTEDYYVTTTNNDGLSDAFVKNNIAAAMQTWQNEITHTDLFGNLVGTANTVANSEPDGKNEFIFGSISDSGVIAVTITYGIFSGTISNRIIVEWDMIFNHVNYNFGDVTSNNNLMDFLSILTHEFGHAIGLGDLYNGACSDMTMYGYSSEGETKKRSLASADKTGIKILYNELSATTPTTTSTGSSPRTASANNAFVLNPNKIQFVLILSLFFYLF
jgi:hypothetical protein